MPGKTMDVYLVNAQILCASMRPQRNAGENIGVVLHPRLDAGLQ